MTIYLHIGFPKTGTSSIQHTLFRNADLLRKKHSINYLSFARNHWPIAFARLAEQRPGWLRHAVQRQNIGRRQIIESGEAALADLHRDRTMFRHHVISSEHLSSLERKGAQAFFSDIQEVGLETKVILYVRHPADDVSSRIQQNIKMGARKLSSLDDVQNKYESQIRTIVDVYGKERLIIKRFGKQYFRNGDLVDDFLSIVNDGDEIRKIKKITKNQSLSLPAVLIMDKINRLSDDYLVKRSLLGALKRVSGPKFLVPRPVVQRYLEMHQTYLSYLKNEFDVVFDEVDLSKFPESLSYEFSEATVESIAAVLLANAKRGDDAARSGVLDSVKGLLRKIRS
ncbi:MAG: hypothetical protein NTV73_16100 [Hyphomicrobiales bacterium]|nr:hypothetical protein [Hyphomicrobiales bacterium]